MTRPTRPVSPPVPPAALAPLTEGLGLHWRPGRAPGQAGELNGLLDGRRVLVRLHQRSVSVEQRFRVAGLHLDTRAGRGAPPDAFATGDAAFDRAFPLCAGSPAVRAALSAPRGSAADFREQAVSLLARWRGQVLRLQWDAVHVVAYMRGPTPVLRWLARLRGAASATGALDPMQVAALLPELAALVAALEGALRAHARGEMERAR